MSHDTQTKQATQAIQSTARPNKKMSLLLMAGHLCCDINQGALVATLPFLVLLGGFSYTAATALLFASNIASAIIQPLFGWLGDRFQKPWIMALGITLAGLGMAGVGIFSTYWLILASAMVSGIGIAMFHPEGGRLANLVAGEKKEFGNEHFCRRRKAGLFRRASYSCSRTEFLGAYRHGNFYCSLFDMLPCSSRQKQYVSFVRIKKISCF